MKPSWAGSWAFLKPDVGCIEESPGTVQILSPSPRLHGSEIRKSVQRAIVVLCSSQVLLVCIWPCLESRYLKMYPVIAYRLRLWVYFWSPLALVFLIIFLYRSPCREPTTQISLKCQSATLWVAAQAAAHFDIHQMTYPMRLIYKVLLTNEFMKVRRGRCPWDRGKKSSISDQFFICPLFQVTSPKGSLALTSGSRVFLPVGDAWYLVKLISLLLMLTRNQWGKSARSAPGTQLALTKQPGDFPTLFAQALP